MRLLEILVMAHRTIENIHSRFGGKDSFFTASLILTLCLWLNILSLMMLGDIAGLYKLLLPNSEGYVLLAIIVILWSTAIGLSTLSKCYEKETKFEITLLKKKVVGAWALLSITVIFPAILIFFSIA